MSSAVSWFVIIGTLGSILVYFLILQLNKSVSKPGQTTGHSYDGIEEYDNPLPAWWYWGFVLTIVFGIGYLIYYPGLGNFPGIGGWTQVKQLEKQQAWAEERYGPIFAQYQDTPIDDLANDPDVIKMGRRLFATNCSVCHGATGMGSFGFPNLTDSEWMWGGTNEAITATIMDGRMGVMTPFQSVLGDEGVTEVASYVMSLSGRDVSANEVEKGSIHYQNYCAVCHGPDAKGNPMFGAPDLTNEIWLYGNSRLRIEHTIKSGRSSTMPAFKDKLGEDKVRILAAFVKRLGEP
ncbi:MAG: cytochrome-c oxidase, cbb3-type subunit III [Pseudomonadales bacterium]